MSNQNIADDVTNCVSCSRTVETLTQCDKCESWYCHTCHGLTPNIVSQMASLFNAGLFWFCLDCRDPTPTPKPFTTSNTTTQTITNDLFTNATQTTGPILKPYSTTAKPSKQRVPLPDIHRETNNKRIPPLLPPLHDKKAWYHIHNPPNTPLNNFLLGKTPSISHTILGAPDTGNDSIYLSKLFASMNLHKLTYVHHHRIPHPSSKSVGTDKPRPLSLTYLTHESKMQVKRSLHLINQSNYPIRFCEQLTKSQLDARSSCATTINELNSTNPLPNHRYAIRGIKNFHIAIFPKPPAIIIE